ncbi:neprilysin-1-like [Haemaphysalis longicornis]
MSESNRIESSDPELSENESSHDSRHPGSENKRPERELVNKVTCNVPQATAPNASTMKAVKNHDAPLHQDSHSANSERRPGYAGVTALVFFTPRSKSPDMAEKPHTTCSSLSCRRDAAYLSDLLNWKLDPCDNFYMFVCSRWRNQFPVAEGHLPVSSDDDYVGCLEGHVRMILEGRSLRFPAVTESLHGVYNACVNARLIEDSGWDGLLEFMSEVSLDGFPLTPPVRRSVSVWKTAAKLLRRTGAAALASVSVVSHPTSPENDIVSIGPPETLMAVSGMDINEVIRLYTSAVFASFKALRKMFIPPVYTLNVVKFASDVENLSSQFNDEDARVGTLDPASALQVFLAELFDGVSVAAYSRPGVEVSIQSPDFIARLVALVEETDLHTVMNFLGVRLMVQVAAFIPESGLAEAYTTLLYGKRLQGDLRWKVCIRVAEKALSPLFQRVALENFTVHVPVTQLTDLVNEIVQQFLSGVSTMPYLDEEARAGIRNVVSKTRFETLAPTWIFNQTLVDEYARNAPSVDGGKPLQSYAAMHEYSFMSSLSRGYGARQCLLDMLFAEGNSTDPAERWLNNATAARIAEAHQCFGKDNASGNGLRDATALRITYSHFLRTLDPRHKEMRFHLGQHRNASATQLFFVYLLLQSCERKTSTDEAPEESMHRWNAALRNREEFLTAFGCPSGSPMVLPEHCNV